MRNSILSIASVIAFMSCGATAPAQKAPPTVSSQTPATLPAGWEEIDQRLVYFTVQLASTETSLDAVNKALKVAGFKQAGKQQQAALREKGNELMDRNGGGPVRWDTFYGKTAEEFYHAKNYVVGVAVSPGRSLAVAAATMESKQRPPQFDYIYHANEKSQLQAEAEVSKLGGQVDALTARRRSLEVEQAAGWSKIASQAVVSRKLNAKPLYRFELKIDGVDEVSKQRQEAVRAGAEIVRVVLRGFSDAQDAVDRDAVATFDALHQVVSEAAAKFNDRLLRSPKLALEAGDAATPLGRVVASADRLADVTKNISDSYRRALEGDRAGDEQRKQTLRAYVQQALFDCATNVFSTSQYVTALAGEWKAEVDVNRPIPVNTPTAVAAVKGSSETDPASAPKTPERVSEAPAGKVNLLSLVDVNQDALRGKWSIVDGHLVSVCESGDGALLRFPYRPPEEYDFTLEFTAAPAQWGMGQLLANNVGWGMTGTSDAVGSGFNDVDGNSDRKPKITDFRLSNGKRVVSRLQVRKGNVKAFIDGKEISSYESDFSEFVSSKFKGGDQACVGIVQWWNTLTVYRAEVVEVSGRGELTRPQSKVRR